MFEAKRRHNLFGFFKIQFIVYKELIYILKKYRYVKKQLPTVFHKHKNACSGE